MCLTAGDALVTVKHRAVNRPTEVRTYQYIPANAFFCISIVTLEQCTNCIYEGGIREGLQQLKTGRHSN
jgi:hypothetical protein